MPSTEELQTKPDLKQKHVLSLGKRQRSKNTVTLVEVLLKWALLLSWITVFVTVTSCGTPKANRKRLESISLHPSEKAHRKKKKSESRFQLLGNNHQEGIPGDYWRNLPTGLMYKTLDLGLHLKSAWHLVQKMLPTETFIVRKEGDLMRNSHLYLKARRSNGLPLGRPSP